MASSDTKPDREGFLRRLENSGDQHDADTPVAASKKFVRIDEKKPLEDKTVKFLEQAGLGSAPVDPASLAALRELCSPREEEKATSQSDVTPQEPPLLEIQTNAVLFRRQPSDLTQSRRPALEFDDGRTDATTAGSVEETKSYAFDKMIVELLESQTALLIDVQRQLEELTQKVHQLQQQQPATQRQPAQQPVVGAQPRAAAIPQQQQPREAGAQPQHHPMFFSKISEIIRVFWAMQRRQVNLDGGMLFKVLVMALILSSRMSKKPKTASLWSTYRMYLGIALVVVGFLMQSGYMSFLHNYFVKQNIPARIWNGETINVDEAVAPRPPPRANAPRAANQENGGWRQTFFGGAIPPPGNNNEEENNDNANRHPLGFLQDILYLLGSFVLSILPMWKPEAIQRNDPAADDEQQQQQQQDEGQQQEENDDGEPEQRPPDQRDAMQPADDEPEDDIYGDD